MIVHRQGDVGCRRRQPPPPDCPEPPSDLTLALLSLPPISQGPCCHDGLSARLIERAGFDFAFMSGFCTAAARLGAPDTGGAEGRGGCELVCASMHAANTREADWVPCLLSASVLLAPNHPRSAAGLMSYAEMVDTGRNCHEATRRLPSAPNCLCALGPLPGGCLDCWRIGLQTEAELAASPLPSLPLQPG